MTISYPSDFIAEKNKPTNIPIVLVCIEVSKAFIGECRVGSTNQLLYVPDLLSQRIDEYLSETGDSMTNSKADGSGWVVSFDKGKNLGAKRFICGKSGNYIDIYNGTSDYPAIDNTPYDSENSIGDKIRIARYVFFAVWNLSVDFFLPDGSSNSGIAVTYLPFPMNIEPIGTTTSGEILNMQMSVSNVNRLMGGYVQREGGLRGNRVIRLLVFDGILDSKLNCKKDVMYIDKITMDAHTVNATLEGKFNVLGIKLPQGMYHRNFCNWKFKSRECGFMWQGGGAGYPNVTGTLDSENFPFADATKCDHTLKGSNGCLAHNNVKRFGGFPAIPSVR